jgi:signal peptidase II
MNEEWGVHEKWRVCASIAGSVLLMDALTKWWVRSAIVLGDSVPVVGDWVRLTHVLNPGAAFGLHVGQYSRPVFTALALIALAVILLALRGTPASARGRLAALALVGGGATGNLVDRVGSGAVMDFLDVGFGALRWPIFNVADVGVTSGALLLVLLLWDDAEADARAGPD